MNKLVISIGILVLIGAGWYFWQQQQPPIGVPRDDVQQTEEPDAAAAVEVRSEAAQSEQTTEDTSEAEAGTDAGMEFPTLEE